MSENTPETTPPANPTSNATPSPKKNTKIYVGMIAGVAIAIVVIVGLGFLLGKNSQSGSDNGNGGNGVALPAGVTAENGYGAPLFDSATVNGEGQTPPQFDVYFDFQCPACKQWHQAFEGPVLEPLGSSGQVNITYYPMTFLDNNLGGDSSQRATAAFGCAVDQGVGDQFYNYVFANQPEEGTGYTNEDLLNVTNRLEFSAEDSEAAAEEYRQCVNAGTYLEWGALVNEAAYERGVQGTPTLFLNNKMVPREAMYDFTKLPEEFLSPAAPAEEQPTQ